MRMIIIVSLILMICYSTLRYSIINSLISPIEWWNFYHSITSLLSISSRSSKHTQTFLQTQTPGWRTTRCRWWIRDFGSRSEGCRRYVNPFLFELFCLSLENSPMFSLSPQPISSFCSRISPEPVFLPHPFQLLGLTIALRQFPPFSILSCRPCCIWSWCGRSDLCSYRLGHLSRFMEGLQNLVWRISRQTL